MKVEPDFQEEDHMEIQNYNNSPNLNLPKTKNEIKCDACDITFDSIVELKAHNAFKSKTVKVCSICSFKSCTKYGLFIHNKNKHPDEGNSR